MKNIVGETPYKTLVGRPKANMAFVKDEDVKGKDVLDIGCGYGWCIKNFLDRGVKHIVGIEISEKDLATAKKSLKDKRLKLQVAGAIELPFDDNSFNTVVSWEVLEHIPKKTEPQMFSEVMRVLKPRGVFYLSTPYANLFSNIFDPAWWLIGHRHYSCVRLQNFGKDAGFKVDTIQIKGRTWTIFASLDMYFSKWLLRRTPVFEKIETKKVNNEFVQKNGYVDAFAKFVKAGN